MATLTALATEILIAAKAIDEAIAISPSPEKTIVSVKPKKHSFGKCFVALRNRWKKGAVATAPDTKRLSDGTVSTQTSTQTSTLAKDYLERYSALPDDLGSLRDNIINSCQQVRMLVETPETALINIYSNWTDLAALQAIAHFHLFESVPAVGSTSYASIATACKVPEQLAFRFIRIGIANGIFTEPVAGQVAHTPRSRWLQRDPGILDLIALNCYELAPASLHYPAVIEKYGDSGEPAHCPFGLINNNLSIFEVFQRSPERRQRFGRAMKYLVSADSYDVKHIIAGYDWASADIPGARAVDIGGGTGHVSLVLAQNTHNIHFEVQDLPPVIADALSQRATYVPAELDARISYVAHSFFEPQPLTETADVIFLRWILHNWSDKYVVQIFSALIPRLRKGTRIFVIEYLLQEEPVTKATDVIDLRVDMMMGVGFNAKERTNGQLIELMKRADRRYRWVATRRPACSVISFVEAVWEG